MSPIARRRSGRAATMLVFLIAASTGAGAQQRIGIAESGQPGMGWTNYADERLGFFLNYPAKVFAPHAADPTDSLKDRTDVRSGTTFASRDGKAWLQVAAFANTDRVSLAAYKSRVQKTGYANARMTYERMSEDFFILSGYRGNDEFYERVVFSCGGRMINVWSLSYPPAQNALYDRIVEEIARTFRPVAGREVCAKASEPVAR